MVKRFGKTAGALLLCAALFGSFAMTVSANSGEEPDPENTITSFEELELIKPDDEDTLTITDGRIADDINAEEYEDESDTPLTPEGNMTLVDDLITKNGKQFLTITSRSGQYYYIVIDRSKNGENNVYFLNQVDERDLLSGMNEEDRTFLEEEAKKKAEAEAEAAKAAEEQARKEAEEAEAAAAAAAQVESEAAAETQTRTDTALRIGNFTLTPQMEAALACGGILVAVLVIVLIVFKKKQPAEQEADPDDYDDFEDDFEEETEEEIPELESEEQ